MRKVVLAVILLAVLATIFPASAAGGNEYKVFMPLVGRAKVCEYTLYQDGTWDSPDYSYGDPFPPPSCSSWRASEESFPNDYEAVCIFEDMSWSYGDGCR